MQQELLCRELLRRIFPDKEILGIRFQEEPDFADGRELRAVKASVCDFYLLL